jgi:hypothetical protein
MKSLATAIVVTALSLSVTPSSHGILIDGDDPTYQTRPTNPEEANLWDHFCYKTNGSGGSVYIGNVGNRFPRGMVLTARHLGIAPELSTWQCMNGAPLFSAEVVNGVPVVERPCLWTPGNATTGQPPFCDSGSAAALNANGVGDILIFSPTSDPWAGGSAAKRDLAIRATPPNTPDPVDLVGNDEAFLIGNGYAAGAITTNVPGLRCYQPLANNQRHWARSRYRSIGYSVDLAAVFTDPQSGQGALRLGDSGSPMWAREQAGPWELIGTALTGANGEPGNDTCFAAASTLYGGGGTRVYKIAKQLVGRANDTDGDGISDYLDNCPTIANPDQRNKNGNPSQIHGGDHVEYSWSDWSTGIQNKFDGRYPPLAGDTCDADFDEDNFVSVSDFRVWSACMSRGFVGPGGAEGPVYDPTCVESDLDGDGIVGGRDFGIFVSLFARNGQGMACGMGFCPGS